MLGVKWNHGQNPTQFIQKNNLPPRTIKCEKGDLICSPEGIRTLVAALRRQSPRPLDDGATFHCWKVFLELQMNQTDIKLYCIYCAGVPGLEPRLTEPESAGLPITPYPKVVKPCIARAKNTSAFIEPEPY